MTIIKVICAWCGKPMGEKDGQGQEGISHGICQGCADEWLEGEDHGDTEVEHGTR